MTFHIRDAEVSWKTVEGFDISAATSAVIKYMGLVANELSRLSHRYGYDTSSTYTVMAQTWDRARSPVRSLAFGRETKGYGAVGLIPDAYYIDSNGYKDLYTFALRSPKWRHRMPEVVWRGSVTGQGAFASPSDIPRVRLALACRGVEGMDVGLTGVHETMEFSRTVLTGFLADHDIVRKSLPVRSFANHKFAIDIDGHANAWGLLEKLILGCCILKVHTPFEQWFYSRLHPWEHYVPVSAGFADLPEIVEWCRKHDDHCEWIAANGRRLATTLRLQAELPRSCIQFMQTARIAQR